MIALDLPIPPSANSLYPTGKSGRRYKSKAYHQWMKEADGWLMLQKRKLRLWEGPMTGPLILTITVPATLRGDVSNRIKITEDFLVSRGITDDDRHNWKVSIERSRELISHCHVEVERREGD